MMKDDTDEDNGTGRNQLVGNIGLYYVCYELSRIYKRVRGVEF